MNNKTAKRSARLPIRFSRLNEGSMFRIAAEPSRGISRSKDARVYQKVHPVYSKDTSDAEHFIILDQEDLVVPLTKGW